jgi:hypothetical protein
MSVTRSIIAATSKGACAKLLKPRGYRRQGPHFWREQEGIYHTINFQASAWGSKDDGEFTVNLGVTTIALYEGFPGHKFPSNPGTALWPISRRIGKMKPSNLDRWWKVSASTDAHALGEEVAIALRDYALPFFERVNGPSQLTEFVRTATMSEGVSPAHVPIILAAIAVERGDAGEASTLLTNAVSECRGKPFESTLRLVAKRLNVPIDTGGEPGIGPPNT